MDAGKMSQKLSKLSFDERIIFLGQLVEKDSDERPQSTPQMAKTLLETMRQVRNSLQSRIVVLARRARSPTRVTHDADGGFSAGGREGQLGGPNTRHHVGKITPMLLHLQ